MESTTRRYATPAQPPMLSSRSASSNNVSAAPIVSFRGKTGRAPRNLVTFEWGRVAVSRRGR